MCLANEHATYELARDWTTMLCWLLFYSSNLFELALIHIAMEWTIQWQFMVSVQSQLKNMVKVIQEDPFISAEAKFLVSVI